MTRGEFLLVALGSFYLLAGCDKPDAAREDRVISVDKDDAEMNAAMARARAEIEPAIQQLEEGKVDSFSVKIPVQDGKYTEYFWLSDLDLQDGIFTGVIDNEPETVHNVKLGQRMTVKKSEIADWLYTRNGKMYGNYTLRILLKKMPPEEAEKYRKVLAE